MKKLNLFEVFVRAQNSSGHHHVGSVYAADEEEAMLAARDLYVRREEGISVWVVRSDAILASEPNESDAMFEPCKGKIYRHPTFYKVPKGVKNL